MAARAGSLWPSRAPQPRIVGKRLLAWGARAPEWETWRAWHASPREGGVRRLRGPRSLMAGVEVGGSSTATSRAATRLPFLLGDVRSWLRSQKLLSKLTFRWGGEKKSQMCLPSPVPPPSLSPAPVFVAHPFSFSCYSLLASSLIPRLHFAILFRLIVSWGFLYGALRGATGEAFTGFGPVGIFCHFGYWVFLRQRGEQSVHMGFSPRSDFGNPGVTPLGAGAELAPPRTR